MKRSLLVTGLLATIGIGASVRLLGPNQVLGVDPASPPAGQPQLAGARPTIDATRYPSLQAAIDAVPEQGGLVQLPAGEFVIEKPLVVSRSDIEIRGAGASTHIRNASVDGKPALILQHPKGRVPTKERLWRISLRDLRITGNPKSGHGIHAVQINEVFLHGVTVSYHGGDGIFLDFCYEDPRVSDCLITYNKGTGLNLAGCHDIVVSANQFEENQDALHCFDGFNLTMTGNNLDDHLGHGVVIEKTYGSVVSGNMIEECNGTAIVLDRDCYGITLSANVIAHNQGGGVDLRDAHGCAVSANTFTINPNHALAIRPGSGRIAVTGNSFSNSFTGDDTYARSTTRPATRPDQPKETEIYGSLLLDGTSHNTITGNTFTGLQKAVELGEKPSRKIIFTGNVLTETTSDHEKLQESLVKDNLVD